MTQPATLSFTVTAAPSCSRPQISVERFTLDVARVAELVGACGVAGFTEVARKPWRAVVGRHFGGRHRAGLAVSDCPVVWAGFAVANRGVDLGSTGIPGIAPTRHTAWAVLEADGFRVGVVSTHMTPGVWRPGNPWQYAARPLNRTRWHAHAARIVHRIAWLRARCDVVVMVGDINRPGTFTFTGLRRVSGRGLLYVGVSRSARAVAVTTSAPRYHQQAADHDACSVTVTARRHP